MVNANNSYPVISASVGRAKPKSRIFRSQSSLIAMFEGFRSLWSMNWWCCHHSDDDWLLMFTCVWSLQNEYTWDLSWSGRWWTSPENYQLRWPWWPWWKLSSDKSYLVERTHIVIKVLLWWKPKKSLKWNGVIACNILPVAMFYFVFVYLPAKRAWVSVGCFHHGFYCQPLLLQPRKNTRNFSHFFIYWPERNHPRASIIDIDILGLKCC